MTHGRCVLCSRTVNTKEILVATSFQLDISSVETKKKRGSVLPFFFFVSKEEI